MRWLDGITDLMDVSLGVCNLGDPVQIANANPRAGKEREEGVSSWPLCPLASRVAQGVSGPSSSCVWNPRVFADDPRGWQCPFARAAELQLCAQAR